MEITLTVMNPRYCNLQMEQDIQTFQYHISSFQGE